MAANVKRVVAVLVSIVWLSLIVVLLAGFFVPVFQEALPTQLRGFTDPEALRERLDILTDSFAKRIGVLIPTEPAAIETPTPDSALSTPATTTPVPAPPTAAPPATESATPSSAQSMASGDDEQTQGAGQPASTSVTVAKQAELRSAPTEDADVIGLVAIGGTVTVNGKDPTGRWYRLEDGTWIGADALVDAPQDQAPVVMAETEQTTPESGEQPTQPGTSTATPPVQLVAVEAVVRLDANLRSGPGTEFDRVDGVYAGDDVNVVGKSADGEWYLLERGAWLFANLVVEAVDVPVVSEDDVTDLPPTPESETEQADTDDEQPDTDTEQPDADDEQPDTDTQQPDADDEQPDTDTQQPDTDDEQPDTDTQQPDTDDEQPDTDTEQPDTDDEQPDTDTQQPDADDEEARPVVNAPSGANLRSGPGLQFDRVEEFEQGQVVTIVAQDPGGEWLQLENGLWIFAALVDNVPEDLPIEPEEATESEPSEDEQAVLATVNIDANLRNGPGLDSTLVASVLTGTQVNVVGRSDDGQWLELDNGYWIFAALVDFPPTEAEEEESDVDEEADDDTGATG